MHKNFLVHDFSEFMNVIAGVVPNLEMREERFEVAVEHAKQKITGMPHSLMT